MIRSLHPCTSSVAVAPLHQSQTFSLISYVCSINCVIFVQPHDLTLDRSQKPHSTGHQTRGEWQCTSTTSWSVCFVRRQLVIGSIPAPAPFITTCSRIPLDTEHNTKCDSFASATALPNEGVFTTSKAGATLVLPAYSTLAH